MFHAKAIVHLSKRHVISPPLQGVREFGNWPFFRSGTWENRNICSGIRENDFVWDSGKDEMSFGNSGKSKHLFGNS